MSILTSLYQFTSEGEEVRCAFTTESGVGSFPRSHTEAQRVASWLPVARAMGAEKIGSATQQTMLFPLSRTIMTGEANSLLRGTSSGEKSSLRRLKHITDTRKWDDTGGKSNILSGIS